MDVPRQRGVVDWLVAAAAYVLVVTPIAFVVGAASEILLMVVVDGSTFDRSLSIGEHIFYAVVGNIPPLLLGLFVGVLLVQLGFQREWSFFGLVWALVLMIPAAFVDNYEPLETPLFTLGMSLVYTSSILMLGLGLFIAMQVSRRRAMSAESNKGIELTARR